jgi:hypothetical protein
MRRHDVGRGRRLRPGFTPNLGLGRLQADSGVPCVFGTAPV